jgi:ATP-dependent Zn protease
MVVAGVVSILGSRGFPSRFPIVDCDVCQIVAPNGPLSRGGASLLRGGASFPSGDIWMDDRILAYHEAGHTVIALALDIPVVLVSIDPRNGHAAVTCIDPASAATCNRDIESICAHVVMKLSGPLSELAFTQTPASDDDWGVDLTSAESLIAEAAAPEYTAELTAVLIEAALDIVAANWPLITKVADQLCIHRTLSGDQVRDLLI